MKMTTPTPAAMSICEMRESGDGEHVCAYLCRYACYTKQSGWPAPTDTNSLCSLDRY